MSKVLRLLVVSVLAAGCALVETPAAGPLVTVETHGGLCPEGECRTLLAIEADGLVHQIEPVEAEIHRATTEAVDALPSRIGRHRLRRDPLAAVLGTAPPRSTARS